MADVRVEHEVNLADFTRWLETRGRSPRNVIQPQEVREILGIGVGENGGIRDFPQALKRNPVAGFISDLGPTPKGDRLSSGAEAHFAVLRYVGALRGSG